MKKAIKKMTEELGLPSDVLKHLLSDETIPGYRRGKVLTVSELKTKQIGDIVWWRFRKWDDEEGFRINGAYEIDDIVDIDDCYELSFIDGEFTLDKRLKDTDLNSYSEYGESYISEAIKI